MPAPKLSDLQDQAMAAMTDENWLAFIRGATLFHDYSFQNRLLIWIQRPDATYVAGYRHWQTLNRFVRKGSKAIYVYAPMLINDRHAGTEPAGDSEKILLFRPVPVFAYEDTEGEDDLIPESKPLTAEWSDECAIAQEQLIASLELAGCPVLFEHRPNESARGIFYPKENRIWIQTERAQVDQLATLFHEASHFLQFSMDEKNTNRGGLELSAEMSAAKALATIGVDATDRSF